MKYEYIEYKNFGRCVKLDNGIVSLIVTLDLGPRVISYSLLGKENVFLEDTSREVYNDKDELKSFFGNGESWYIYGGHRLWSSPESFPESYTPDNGAVRHCFENGTLVLMPELRKKVGEKHEIRLTLDDGASDVIVEHKITNISEKPRKFSLWPMTVMAKGGVEIAPICQKDTGLLSNRRIVLWPYSNITDERFFIGNKYMSLRQTDKTEAFKIGINNEAGWSACLIRGQLFVKRFEFSENAEYPDYGVNFETYTNSHIMEIETLSPLKTLMPNEFADFAEHWTLIGCSESFDPRSEKEIAAFAEKYIGCR